MAIFCCMHAPKPYRIIPLFRLGCHEALQHSVVRNNLLHASLHILSCSTKLSLRLVVKIRAHQIWRRRALNLATTRRHASNRKRKAAYQSAWYTKQARKERGPKKFAQKQGPNLYDCDDFFFFAVRLLPIASEYNKEYNEAREPKTNSNVSYHEQTFEKKCTWSSLPQSFMIITL